MFDYVGGVQLWIPVPRVRFAHVLKKNMAHIAAFCGNVTRVSGLKKKNEVDVYENRLPCDKRISVIRSSMLFVSKKNGSWKRMKLQGNERTPTIGGII